LFGLLCAWREVLILRQHTFWHARWDILLIKMPDIQDVMDVTLEELSTEQQLQLKEAIDQFQQKCLMSFSNTEVVCHTSSLTCQEFYYQENLIPHLLRRNRKFLA
jgi:hypothetical protein